MVHFGPKQSKELQRWSDEAMFAAEPMPDVESGPRVYLLSMTADPLGVIASACKMYKGEVVRSLSEVTHAERREFFEQIQKTKLKAPFEFVKFHFMIEGVTRSLTHQMVRQRTAVYAQESLRFAVKEDMADEVALPPSLSGTVGLNELGGLDDQELADRLIMNDEVQRQRELWDIALEGVGHAYSKLIDSGMPAEDARGLLPHNVTTRLHYCTDLRALQDHAGNRLCTQAQFEWRLLWARMAEAIRNYEPHGATIQATQDNLEPHDIAMMGMLDSSDRWQYEAIADMFKPVCYLTGKCEFKANFDRHCEIRERVDANEKYGRPSSKWDEVGVLGDGRDFPDVPWMKVVPGGHDQSIIPAIQPEEWLLNPNAARRKS